MGAVPALPLPIGVSSSHLGPELPYLQARYCLPPVIALRIIVCVYKIRTTNDRRTNPSHKVFSREGLRYGVELSKEEILQSMNIFLSTSVLGAGSPMSAWWGGNREQ